MAVHPEVRRKLEEEAAINAGREQFAQIDAQARNAEALANSGSIQAGGIKLSPAQGGLPVGQIQGDSVQDPRVNEVLSMMQNGQITREEGAILMEDLRIQAEQSAAARSYPAQQPTAANALSNTVAGQVDQIQQQQLQQQAPNPYAFQ